MQIRVLVAEDHPLVREGVIEPDVMVLDLRMPGLGGAVVLERLRAELPETRALVMTAKESPKSLFDAVAAGAAGYLSKRTTGEELRRAVITTYAGGSVIAPELAGHLLREVSGKARGEGSSVRPLVAPRELEVLVQNHLARVRKKTGLRRRPELARWAVEHEIASAPSTRSLPQRNGPRGLRG